MSDLFKKAISLGVGLTIVSKEKVEKVVDELVKRGELAPSESRHWLTGWWSAVKKNAVPSNPLYMSRFRRC